MRVCVLHTQEEAMMEINIWTTYWVIKIKT